MNMRFSVFLLAMALLIAYAIPAMSAECAQLGDQSCGKAKTDCGGGQCANYSCEGNCVGGCECGGCGGECGESRGKGKSCEIGSDLCGDDAECKDCPKDGSYQSKPRRSEYRERGMGMRSEDRKSYYFAEMRDFQRLVDMELKICPCQKITLAEERKAYVSQLMDLQRLYFADRSIGIEDLNHRLTLLNREYDRYTRKVLSPLQDTVFPEHMWMLYSSPIWNRGFHPGSKHVLRELLDEQERDFRKRFGKRGKWAGER